MRQIKITSSITQHDSIIDRYLQDISKEELIDALQEVELAQKIKAGDQQALEKLVKANLRFVVSIAKQYQNQGVPLIDLINEGNIGLITAAKKFDETKGFKFISYAVRRIRQAIQNAIMQHGKTIRIPVNAIEKIYHMRKTNAILEQQLEREPTQKELAEALEIDFSLVNEIQNYPNNVYSLETPVIDATDSTDEKTLIDVVPNTEQDVDYNLIQEGLQQEIHRLLNILTEKEKQILILSYGLFGNPQDTLEGIAQKLALTKEKVKQIKTIALRKLQYKYGRRVKFLKQYL